LVVLATNLVVMINNNFNGDKVIINQYTVQINYYNVSPPPPQLPPKKPNKFWNGFKSLCKLLWHALLFIIKLPSTWLTLLASLFI